MSHFPQKTDVVEHLRVLDHVGILSNEPPDTAELLFIKSPEELHSDRSRRKAVRPLPHTYIIQHRREMSRRIFIIPPGLQVPVEPCGGLTGAFVQAGLLGSELFWVQGSK